MNLGQVKYVHFIGIGGIGMSALARYFKHLGKEISGYDKVSTPLTRQLSSEGMKVYYEENVSLLPAQFQSNSTAPENLIIYTPAIPKSHVELIFFREHQARLFKRAEVLGMISKDFPTIAVAGTHGKTSTTSMLAFLLREAEFPFAGFVGGISENFSSNLVLQGEPKYMLTEADEYDRSFLLLQPEYAIVTSMDPDHLDIYGDQNEMESSYKQFCGNVSPDGFLLLNYKLRDKFSGKNVSTYGLNPEAAHRSTDIRIDGSKTVFNFSNGQTEINDLEFNMPGLHNLENATAAIAMALKLGIEKSKIISALPRYKGVKRRFEFHINRPDLIYIDDYAHHPEEINALINSVRKMYPDKKVIGVFQPHLFSRTRDFGKGFAESLSKLDELILLEIYPAREAPIPGIDSQWLLGQVELKNKQICAKSELVEMLDQKRPEIILTIGAGDIDQMIEPIKNHFNKSGDFDKR